MATTPGRRSVGRLAVVLAMAACAAGCAPVPPPVATTAALRDEARPDACPAAVLPAYAHNDYENDRPLHDALALGYRGVEVDVFLVEGVLRLGHDRRAARRGRVFEAAYLAPLDSIAARCGSITGNARPFLLTIEIKEPSPETFRAVQRSLARHAWLLSVGSASRTSRIEVIHVGWTPVDPGGNDGDSVSLRTQYRILRPDRPSPDASMGRVRLVSLDYGKTMGRMFETARSRRRWLEALRAAKREAPDRLLRVHNVPTRRDIYEALLAAGVDLIGTKQLRATAAALTPRSRPH